MIFVIDDLSLAFADSGKETILIQELLNVIYGNFGAPIAIVINKKTSVAQSIEDDLPSNYMPIADWNAWVKKSILDKLPDKQKYGVKVFESDLIAEKGLD